MKERPILFSGPMVRAILEGRKTQTRRVVKRTKAPECDTLMVRPEAFGTGTEFFMDAANPVRGGTLQCNCPYGVPGDRLWVRETWWQAHRYPGTLPCGEPEPTSWCGGRLVHYAADGDPPNTPNRHYPDGLRCGSFAAPDPYAMWHKRPSIHMPHWASRLTLEVVSVRVERVHQISEADAIAEGVASIDEYAHLWDSINGVGAWALNPWVWVIEFKKVEAANGDH